MWRTIFFAILGAYLGGTAYIAGVFGVAYVCKDILGMPNPYGGIIGLIIPTLCGFAFLGFMAWREGVKEKKEEQS
ncbi:MAG: hypothetical protein HQL37_08335 [Alphaproteobacteria bacterium]|nr:hypothetical protein [Alphaproteobacteria bacterium]